MTTSPVTRVLDEIRTMQRKHHLFTPRTLLLAVSGGTDSVALLLALWHLRDELQLDLVVASLDHGIRGTAAAEDVGFVVTLAAQLQLPVTTRQVNAPAYARQHAISIETAARMVRYRALAEIALEGGISQIATGHQRDDQAETVLMHVLRGSGLMGLRGMSPSARLTDLNLPLPSSSESLRLLRPLLDTSRQDLAQFLAELGITPRQDETNADLTYRRNHVRALIRNNLAAHEIRAMARLAAIAREEHDALLSMLPPLDATCAISRPAFCQLQPALQRLWLRMAASQRAPALTLEYDQTISAVAVASAPDRTPRGRLFLGRNVEGAMLFLYVTPDQVWVSEARAFPAAYPRLAPASSLDLTTATCSALADGWEICRSAHYLTLPEQDELRAVLAFPPQATIMLRPPQAGDRFRPAGMNGKSRKISDMLIDMKVPREWRGQVPILVINDELAWFVAPTEQGFRSRIAEPFRPPVNPQAALRLAGATSQSLTQIEQFSFHYVSSL